MSQLNADEIKTELSKLDNDARTKQVVEWLGDHLPRFEGLGVPSGCIVNALQVELIDRACEAHDKIRMGEWFANVAGWLLACHADGKDPKDTQVPTHHAWVELLKYSIGRYLAEGYDQANLRDLLVTMINELSNNAQPQKEIQ